MEMISAEALVIGSGLAGLMAALEIRRSGLEPLLLGKFAIGKGTNSSIANGGFTATTPCFSKEEHRRLTLETGKGLNKVSLVETLVDLAPESMNCLRDHGVQFVETAMGYRVARPEASSELPGALLIRPLVERLKDGSTRWMPGNIVFELIVEDGEVRGAFGFSREGNPFLIQSGAVVLATGGAGGIYQRNDNQRGIRGDGYALALQAGLPLYDMEFVQFYPIVLAEPRLSTFMLYPPYPPEARLLDSKGEDLVQSMGISKGINHAVLVERDRFAISLYERIRENDVYLDLTGVSEKDWGRFPLNFLARSPFPFRERSFLVAPAVHFFMGGVEIDEQGKTALPGLFAAGEVTWGIHGANRLGGNALTECAVFGTLAGRSAADRVRAVGKGEGKTALLSEKALKRWGKKAEAYLKKRRGGGSSLRDLLAELKSLVWKQGGPVRDRDSLSEGLGRLAALEEKAGEAHPSNLRELFQKRELDNMILISKAILKGSLLRRESRGAFCRNDFPDRDDLNWAKHSLCHLQGGEIDVVAGGPPPSPIESA